MNEWKQTDRWRDEMGVCAPQFSGQSSRKSQLQQYHHCALWPLASPCSVQWQSVVYMFVAAEYEVWVCTYQTAKKEILDVLSQFSLFWIQPQTQETGEAVKLLLIIRLTG